MRACVRVGFALLVVAGSLVGGHAAQAGGSGETGPEPVPLTGETLITSEAGDPGTSEVNGTCDPLGTSTFTFRVTGVAVGPYPGTFVEEGTMTFGPFGAPGNGFVPVSYDATFSITSSAGTVSGTKTLTDVPQPGFGACGEFVFAGTEADAVDFNGYATYTASITTSAGSATDSGESFVNYGDSQIRGEPNGNGFAFGENFTSTSFTADGHKGGGDDDDDD